MPLSIPRFPSSAASYPREVSTRWTSSAKQYRSRMAFPFSILPISAVFVLVVSSLFLSLGKSAPAHGGVCSSHDLPNTLAESFPNSATGVLNATLAIIPISLESARRLIPPQYRILEGAYRSLVPDFPEGMYPVMLQAAHDHDVQFRAYGIAIEDFSRVGFEFPFLDFMGDGHSSFRWAPAQLISATNDIALEGSRAYGTIVSPAEYEPLCDAYESLPNGAMHFKGSSVNSAEFIELEMKRLPLQLSPYPMELFKNITNQPTFANGTSCDNMIRLFNTTMSTGEYAPRAVLGSIKAKTNALFQGAEKQWTEIYGVQVATPFIENNYLDCKTMRGYEGTGGPGDSYVQGGGNDNDEL